MASNDEATKTAMDTSVWVFSGASNDRFSFPGGVFTDRVIAEEWIERHKLTGTLTRYPLNIGVYDWAVARGWFTPMRPQHTSAEFIGTFSSATQEHYHYHRGVGEGDGDG
ncbi:MAG TPA: hypothetical protein VIL85_24440 [Thermomicrobiales bacterium]|jgi:hypothetical protein